jgi:hypothetical protein
MEGQEQDINSRSMVGVESTTDILWGTPSLLSKGYWGCFTRGKWASALT